MFGPSERIIVNHSGAEEVPEDALFHLLEEVKETAVLNLETHGSLLPVLFVNCLEDGDGWTIGVFGMPEFGKEEMRDFVSSKIQENIMEGKLREFIIVSEAWAAYAEDVFRENKRVSDLDQKVEVALVHYASSTKEIQVMGRIDRSGEKPTIKEWDSSEGTGKQTGFHQEMNTRFGAAWARSIAKKGLN